jgi:hypothetical protein
MATKLGNIGPGVKPSVSTLTSDLVMTNGDGGHQLGLTLLLGVGETWSIETTIRYSIATPGTNVYFGAPQENSSYTRIGCEGRLWYSRTQFKAMNGAGGAYALSTDGSDSLATPVTVAAVDTFYLVRWSLLVKGGTDSTTLDHLAISLGGSATIQAGSTCVGLRVAAP